jgi:hypothetical protein
MGCDRHTHVDARSRLPRCVLKNADSGSVFSLRIRDEAVPRANPAHRGAGGRDRRATGRGLGASDRPDEDAPQARRRAREALRTFYANATPHDLLKAAQDRIGVAELAAKSELKATEGDLEG